MKKKFAIILTALFTLAGSNAFAQIDGAQWSAGGGFTTMHLVGADKAKVFDEMLPGYYFGASFDYAFSTIDGLTVEPGAYIVHYAKTFASFMATHENSHKGNYLRLPVNLKYTFYPGTSDLRISAFTGPRFNLGLGGSLFDNSANYSGIKPFDAQWGIGASILVLDAISVSAGYDFGLSRCARDRTIEKIKIRDNADVKRNAFFVGVNFAF